MWALIIIAAFVAAYFILMFFYPEWVGISAAAEKRKQKRKNLNDKTKELFDKEDFGR